MYFFELLNLRCRSNHKIVHRHCFPEVYFVLLYSFSPRYDLLENILADLCRIEVIDVDFMAWKQDKLCKGTLSEAIFYEL